MDPDGNLILCLILLAVALFLKAFIMCSKTAIVLFPDARIRKLCEEGDERAQRIARLTGEPTHYNDATLLLSHFFTVLIAILATLVAYRTAWPWLISLSLPQSAAGVVLVAAAALLTCFLVLVLATYLPKNIAGKNPERISLSTVGLLSVILQITRPFRFFTVKCADALSKLLGFDPASQVELVTEEEIRMMVDVGNEKGVIEESQKEMINNIFEFDDTTAEEIMTHRTEISAVPVDCSLNDILDIAITDGYSRIPAYREDIDNIVGVIYVKDLLKLLGGGAPEEFHVESYLRPVFFVPESNRLRELFTQFTERKVQLAVVVDEYGGTSGIVTMEDVLESIVGNIQDEYDNEEEEFSRIDENTWSIDGGASLDDVSKALGVELVEEDADVDVDTLGGLIIDTLGRIPGEEETPTVEIAGVRLTAVSIVDRRIARVKAVILPPPEGPEKAGKDA
ncbi:hemolysin family protein [Zongyangia hominis]|uniref:HlyC/CorC family transporter n=1 Tax=Zongyangia hominis TaxID=2763677 RepID=A0A926IBV7_9FIRM|nr:hemolysin family protein [Zongyangia hominis]MBC8570693.1 HlyC/CorC family transporter [Zongyangia hominis]